MSNRAIEMVTSIQRAIVGAVAGLPDQAGTVYGGCQIGIDKVALRSQSMRLAAPLGAGAMMAVSQLHAGHGSRRYS